MRGGKNSTSADGFPSDCDHKVVDAVNLSWHNGLTAMKRLTNTDRRTKMGATTFTTTVSANNADAAFYVAVSNAKAYRWDEDYCADYPGDITCKNSFYMDTVPAGMSTMQHINNVLNSPSPRCDKWSGLAGCVDNGNGSFTFFGWAPC